MLPRKKLFVGFDVSTSFVGICVLNEQREVLTLLSEQLSQKSAKEPKKSLFQKADRIKEVIKGIFDSDVDYKIRIEEPLEAFRSGATTSNTIALLNRFNGMVSYMIWEIFGIEPEYEMSQDIREMCGVRLVQKKKANGLNHKQQTFNQVVQRIIEKHPWLIKNGKPALGAMDATDAYVTALSIFYGKTPPKVKKPRAKKTLQIEIV
jgi:hypothetical protein